MNIKLIEFQMGGALDQSFGNVELDNEGNLCV